MASARARVRGASANTYTPFASRLAPACGWDLRGSDPAALARLGEDCLCLGEENRRHYRGIPAGERAATYDETTVARYMRGKEIAINVDLGIGGGSAKVWTCDLTHDYISINADYRS